jgi:hypothetical protein
LSDRARLPIQARVLRLAFFATYWIAIACLCASLAIAVIGSQVRFWSSPPGTVPERDLEVCRSRVRALAAELDREAANAMDTASRRPDEALPAFRRFAGAWESRWRRVRFECAPQGEDGERQDVLAVHEEVLDHRFALESLVRRYASAEGRAHARIARRLP